MLAHLPTDAITWPRRCRRGLAAMLGVCLAAWVAAPARAEAGDGGRPPAASAVRLEAALQNAMLQSVAASGTPGAAVTVTCDGATLFSQAVGLSHVSTGGRFRRYTLSSVGSVTKMVTGAIVMRMVEDGLINLDAPIGNYLRAPIPAKDLVTVRNLISMRSGYADIENSAHFIAAANNPNHVWARDEFYNAIRPPHFTPGAQFEYSNVNFLLLSAIIAAVYPGGVEAAFQTYVRDPAGLGADVAFAREPSLAPLVAHGYQTTNGVTFDVDAGARNLGVNTSVWGTIWGDGGVVATSRGLARFADALYAGRLVKPSTLAAMEAPLAAGGPYGLAMELNTIDGHGWFGHLGAFEGYTAFIAHDPARAVTIAGIANALNLDTGAQALILEAVVAAYDAAGTCAAPRP